MDHILRRLRGAVGTALLWAGAWSVGSILLLTLFVMLGAFPALPPAGGLLRIAARFGLTGLGVGAGFSAFLAYAYADEQIGTIRSIPFVLGGAAISAVLAPFAGGSALIGALLGAGTATLTLSAARRADARSLPAAPTERRLEG